MVRLSVLSCFLACLPLASHASAENLSVNAVWLKYDSLPTSSDLLFAVTNPPMVSSGAINIDRRLPTLVIEWQYFDIGLNAGVVFIMSPSSRSVINRVIGDSQDIFGSSVLSSSTGCRRLPCSTTQASMCLQCLKLMPICSCWQAWALWRSGAEPNKLLTISQR